METGLEAMSDTAVIEELHEATRAESLSLARVLRSIIEFDRRRLLPEYSVSFAVQVRHGLPQVH